MNLPCTVQKEVNLGPNESLIFDLVWNLQFYLMHIFNDTFIIMQKQQKHTDEPFLMFYDNSIEQHILECAVHMCTVWQNTAKIRHIHNHTSLSDSSCWWLIHMETRAVNQIFSHMIPPAFFMAQVLRNTQTPLCLLMSACVCVCVHAHVFVRAMPLFY